VLLSKLRRDARRPPVIYFGSCFDLTFTLIYLLKVPGLAALLPWRSKERQNQRMELEDWSRTAAAQIFGRRFQWGHRPL